VTAARGLAFTTAVGVIDRVHGDAAHAGLAAQPLRAASLTPDFVHVVGVRHGANRGHADVLNHAHFARGHAELSEARITANDLRVSAGRARHLDALQRLQFDVVNDGADRDRLQRHRIARLHIDLLTGDDAVAHLQTLRRNDVSQIAVRILDQSNPRRAVRIVLKPLDLRFNAPLAALEVDLAVRALVPAAGAERSHAADIVAAARLRQAFGQRLHRLALVQLRAINDHKLTAARRGRAESLQRHL